MAVDRVKFQDIVASQVPDFVKDDFPLLVDFLKEYYVSQEFKSGTYDLIQNLDQYVKVDQLYNVKNSTVLREDIDFLATTIITSADGNFTDGFPDTNGLLQIDEEIILYQSKTDTTFEGCVRGFSGVTDYTGTNTPDQLTFKESLSADHKKGATIVNLNVKFLQEFFSRIKTQFVPGFSERTLFQGLDQRNFIYNADSFYKSKGTDQSFEILFRALYGVDVEVVKPSKFLFKPSDADYRLTEDYVIEGYTGDPLELKNLTFYQDSTQARGTVTNVEKIDYADGDFYQIAIDYGYQRDTNVDGTIYGKFSPNPKTKIINNVSVGSTVIDVDSTVSFPQSGTLVLTDVDGDDFELVYQDKTLTQFLGVTTTTSSFESAGDICLDGYGYAIGPNGRIEVKIITTLTNLRLDSNTFFFKKDDTINIKSIGLESKQEKSEDWYYNVKTHWIVKEFTLIDATQKTYNIKTFDNQFIQPGYRLIVKSTAGDTRTLTVDNCLSKTEFVAVLSDIILPEDLKLIWTLENQILKGVSTKYNEINNINANVLNTYEKFDGSFLVASNSIPNYSGATDPFGRKIIFSGTANGDNLVLAPNGDHGFYTGDAVYYSPKTIIQTITTPNGFSYDVTSLSGFDNLNEGVYYIKRISATTVKLARSTSDIFNNRFLIPTGTVTNNEFCYYDFYQKNVSPQKIYREVNDPSPQVGQYLTAAGYNGILVNGVELINYKSFDTIFYGGIKTFDINNRGQGYDVVNPPRINVTDNIGTGATGTVAVEGSLKEIRVIDSGFDYTDDPIVVISGGQGEDASARINLASVDHEVLFNAGPGPKSGLNFSANTVGFTSFHKFRDNERIVYVSDGVPGVTGLTTNADYYAHVVDASTITLHDNYNDANAGINTVNISGYGIGNQVFKSYDRKKVVSNIVVDNQGKGYKNKERLIVGVNTAANTFTIGGHGYEEGEIIQYTAGSSPIVGLGATTKYYVCKIDSDTFALSEVGTGQTARDYFYNNKIKTNLLSTGNGTFNYEPITVRVQGTIGVNTATSQDFSCQVQPIFRGSIDSIDVTDQGVGYGASEILNFNRQPVITFNSGEGALLTPIISNGRIVEVLVNMGGEGYNSPPNLTISGIGSFCRLTPIIENGSITEVKVISGGAGYGPDTTVLVQPAGIEASVFTNINQWTVNLFARSFNNITDDDGIIETSLDLGSLQYSHLYPPRPLRENSYSIDSEGNTLYSERDLQRQNDIEVNSSKHSPILGWAYDGHPIYGPYAYNSPDGGPVTRMKSSYELAVDTSNRPPVSQYSEGFFVEDYVYRETGDLDECNGRFAITPDYPEGTYAYYTTIAEFSDTFGPFNNSRRPVFPYAIGNRFNSKPNAFNYDSSSNHVDYDIQKNEWFRNTTPYRLNSSLSGYDYIFNSNSIKKQVIDVTSASVGNIQGVGILTGGRDYRVKDQLIFDNSFTSGKNAAGKVERVSGKVVDSVSVASTQVFDIEFTPFAARGEFVGYSSVPHNLSNNDIVNISGLSEHYDGLDGNYTIGIGTGDFVLLTAVGDASVTGLTTFLNLGGALQYPFVRPDDIMVIDSEKFKVLNTDRQNQRLRVLRAQAGTAATSHLALTKAFKDPRSFTITAGTARTTKTPRLNNVLYFNPAESVGLGTVLGTGVGTTITFSNPGAGASVTVIPPQAILYPNHGLLLNEVVEYSTNGGASIEAWNGVTGSSSTVPITGMGTFFAVPLTNRFVGLSTNKVGISTLTGKYVGINSTPGLLFFTGVGTDVYHSLRTKRADVISGELQKNVVTVSTASTHGLFVNDSINFNLKPKDEVVVRVKYNEFNRRIVFDSQSFLASDVSTSDNSITFANNIFKTGDKVIYSSTTPSGGLVNEKMYYIVVHTPVKVRLVETRAEIKAVQPRFVNITSATAGTLSKVNPRIDISKNNTLKFDLSDPSLAFVSNNNLYSAFDFNLYSDSFYRSLYLTSAKSSAFEVTKSGQVGIDSTANLTLFVSDFVPSVLWYSFKNVNTTFSPLSKRELLIDEDVSSFNQVNLVGSQYDGSHTVTGIASTSFTYNLSKVPDVVSYGSTNSSPTYDTSSLTAYGSITKAVVTNPGAGYRSLPGINTVRSGFGTDAILFPESRNIGQILNYQYSSKNIGFDYPSDYTLRTVANLPEILEIESLNSFVRIGISSNGKNYLLAPDLVVIDGYSNRIVDEVILTYELGDNQVSIIRNTTGLYETPPRIIPINNSNGVGINSIVYNSSTKIVRAFFDTIFNDPEDFPYVIGEKVMIEGVNVGLSTVGTGYNSDQYNYSLFPITGVLPNLGGTGAFIDYDMSDVLNGTQHPGSPISPINGRVIPESHLPIFDPVLEPNDYFQDETVTNGLIEGNVESYNKNTEILKVSTPFDFQIGDTVRGLTSNTQGIVKTKYDFNAEVQTGAGATIINGWNRNTGFLNDNLQRIPNNEYYQNFSYSLKSSVDFDTWNNSVGALNHTAGFKRFGDLEVESAAASVGGQSVPINAIDSNLETIVDIVGEGHLNCFYDYDNVTETSFLVNGKEFSNEIIFDNRILSDFFQSVGNRVLSIDDISSQFNSNERPTPFQPVASFNSDYTYNKIITYARDRIFTDERQFSIVSMIQDESVAYMQEYATIYSYPPLGYYDYITTADGWDLLFYPVKYEFNVYDVSAVAFSILGDKATVGSRPYGDIALVDSQREPIPASTVTTIVSVGTSYRALKVMTLIEEVSSDIFHSAELNILHNGTDVQLLEYGNMSEDETLVFQGIGTYGARINGGNVIVEFHPSVGTALTANSAVIAISSGASPGSEDLNVSRVGSAYTFIAASGTPTANVIDNYEAPYETGYHLVVVENTTDNEFEFFEFAALDSSSNECCVEWANLSTGSGIGTIGVTSTTGGLDLVYTPIANKAVTVRSYFNKLQIFNNNTNPDEIDLNNLVINSDFGDYAGTKISVRDSFELTHKGNPIFSRRFDGSSSVVVDLSNDFIQIPNHFFVSGENVSYAAQGIGHTAAIGIVTATIPGIGATAKLPEDIFVVKIDEGKIKFAATAEDALSDPPVTLTLNSVGIGNSHTITAKKQNSKALVAIDNMIQAPIAPTPHTSSLVNGITFDLTFLTTLTTGISSSKFVSGDIIKIDDEFMIVRAVDTFGIDGNISVRRPVLGSVLAGHAPGSTIQRFSGNYNIVGNSINFASAPYGNIPIGSTTNPPDEQDWTGITSSSTFQGRTFMKGAGAGTTLETYNRNHVFDDYSTSFTGVTSIFTLQSEGVNVTGINTDTVILTNNIYQSPQGVQVVQGDYQVIENNGISSVRYLSEGTPEGYDPNKSRFPAGGLIVSVGSTEGNGYQPLASAGGTATVSAAGTISAISIGNSGSGYRAGAQVVNVGVQTFNGVIPSIENIGTATIQNGHIVSVNITNPGSGYTSTNTPVVVFDDPLSYTDIPLEYAAHSSGIGNSATIDIVVGAGSSVISFELRDQGFGYSSTEVLTIPTGGLNGIPLTGTGFTEFQLTIDTVYSDQFNGFSLGEFEVFDSLSSQFDGTQKSFKLLINDQPVSIRSKAGSNVDVEQTLLVFLNDILQEPGVAYQFNGGSIIKFTEPPNGPLDGVPGSGDTSKVIFYKGSGDADVIFTDILETIKVGDTLDINNNPELGQPITLDQTKRTVTGINTLDSVETNNYPGPGISSDQTILRPVTWCKQITDKFINGGFVGKDRIEYEPEIYPASYLIQTMGVSTTTAYVDTVRPLYNSNNEAANRLFQNAITIISQDSKVGASATATVSVGGSITALNITNAGAGYTVSTASVTIGSGGTATAIANITNGSVTSFTISEAGTGYTATNPPSILIDTPVIVKEEAPINSFAGDFGRVVGFSSTKVGAQSKFIFDLFIDKDSFMRDPTYVGTGVTVSQLDVGDYLTIFNTNINAGGSFETQDASGASVGTAITFSDGVYEVTAVSTELTPVAGYGVTAVRRITTNVGAVGNVSFGSTVSGEFSWGKILIKNRKEANLFNSHTDQGFTGLSTSTLVTRSESLRFTNYL